MRGGDHETHAEEGGGVHGGPAAAFRCLARHPMVRKQVWRARTGEGLYEREVASIGGGEGSDPLADLLALFPPNRDVKVRPCSGAGGARGGAAGSRVA